MQRFFPPLPCNMSSTPSAPRPISRSGANTTDDEKYKLVDKGADMGTGEFFHFIKMMDTPSEEKADPLRSKLSTSADTSHASLFSEYEKFAAARQAAAEALKEEENKKQ
ncbi:hypothetical protein BZG36_01845 [Bifiguratus adelaidae]|uniref:Uncharacterized protein n=1 Tax=Bifiguratus adelaidae TaxID=1938954 RepID=A0A261Y2E6_9FUNG|nr:hypothetical protein BZG36_01845 [Bifiguratus adelaidae]